MARSGLLTRAYLEKILYLATQMLMAQPRIELHTGCFNPDSYCQIIEGNSAALSMLLQSAVDTDSLGQENGDVICQPKLNRALCFERNIGENLLAVYANEVAPMTAIASVVNAAIDTALTLTPTEMAAYRLSDELRALEWDRRVFSQEKHRPINTEETATADPSPFLLRSPRDRKLGVLLVHGFLANPGEMRPFGEAVHAVGYSVMGVRLKGHGTSPWDLRARTRRDWERSVHRRVEILRAYCEKSCLAGFSTGGTLALLQALTSSEVVAGIAAVSPVFRFRNRRMHLVPLVHGANRLLEWFTKQGDFLPFRPAETEHPTFNYRHMPVRGLYELTLLASTVKQSLSGIHCPTLIIQGTADPVVDHSGAAVIVDRPGGADK